MSLAADLARYARFGAAVIVTPAQTVCRAPCLLYRQDPHGVWVAWATLPAGSPVRPIDLPPWLAGQSPGPGYVLVATGNMFGWTLLNNLGSYRGLRAVARYPFPTRPRLALGKMRFAQPGGGAGGAGPIPASMFTEPLRAMHRRCPPGAVYDWGQGRCVYGPPGAGGARLRAYGPSIVPPNPIRAMTSTDASQPIRVATSAG